LTRDIIEDTRINRYRSAVHALQVGEFDTAVGAGREDALGLLGEDLNNLAVTLRRRFDELTALLALSEQVGAGLFLDHVLQCVYDSFKAILPYDRLGCALLDKSRTKVVARWARSSAPHLSIRPGYSQPIAGSSLAEILRTGQPRIINDLEQYLVEHPQSESTQVITREGVRSNLTCPLMVQGAPVGFLFFSSNRPDTYREAHQDLFMRCAAQLSVVVERSLHYEELYTLNQRLHAAQASLEKQANTDALTGLMNRRALLARLDGEIEELAKSGTELAICMVDIDHFKRINDTFGHLAGDAVLRHVAVTLASTCRATEALGRYGGEEFLYVLPAAGRPEAERAAERLRAAVAATEIAVGERKLRVTVSVGATAAAAGSPTSSDVLIGAADRALYAAKMLGRDRIQFEPTPDPPSPR